MKTHHLRRLAAAMAAMHPRDRAQVSRCIPVHLLPEVARLSTECQRRFFLRPERPPITLLFLTDGAVTSVKTELRMPVSIGDVSKTLDRLAPWMAAAAMRTLSDPEAEGVTPAARELLSAALLRLSQERSSSADAVS